MIDPSARIHATADIEPDVSVGPGTSVWHRAQLRTGARIGRDAVIGRDVFIDVGVSLGDRVKVQNGALIYHGVTIADGVFIGPGAILTNDRRPRALNADGGLARATDWTVTPISIAPRRVDRRRCGRRRRMRRRRVRDGRCRVGRDPSRPGPCARRRQSGSRDRLGLRLWRAARRLERSARRRHRRSPADLELACSVCHRHYTSITEDGSLRERAPSPDRPGVSA